MALTRYGVCYDLAGSPFVADWGPLELHFSTRGHMEKFMLSVSSRTRWLRDSLSRRFKVDVQTDGLAALQLYRMIEDRGFYVVFEGEAVTCPDDLAFRGRLVSARGSRTPCEHSTEQLLG